MQILPVLTGLTLYVVVIFILQTGNANATWNKVSNDKVIWIPFCVAIPVALAMYVFLMPHLRKVINAQEARREAARYY